MSTLTVPGVPVARRSTGVRILLWLLLFLVLLAAGALAYAYFVARSALPQLDGTLRVKGLSAPVKVTRDGHGEPGSQAADLEALFLGPDLVVARDRVWE